MEDVRLLIEDLKTKCEKDDGCFLLPEEGSIVWKDKRYKYDAAGLKKIIFNYQANLSDYDIKQAIIRTLCKRNNCISHLVLITREENNRIHKEQREKEEQERKEREEQKRIDGIHYCYQCEKEFKKEYAEGIGKFENSCSLRCLYLSSSKLSRRQSFDVNPCYLESNKYYFFVNGRELSAKELANKAYLEENNYTCDPVNMSCQINKLCFNYTHFIEKNYLDDFIESLCEEDKTYFLKVLKTDVLKKLSTYIVEHKILDFLEDKTDNLDFLEKYKKWMEFFERYHKDYLKNKQDKETKVIMKAKDLYKSHW